MRKIIKTLLFLFPIGLMALLHVQADEVDVTLSYRMEGTPVTHELKITVNGPGVLQDGDAEIRDGTNVYQLREGAEKVFLIKADEGSHLASIVIDGQDMTDVNKKQILFQEMRNDSEAVVIFEKNPKTEYPNQKDPAVDVEHGDDKGIDGLLSDSSGGQSPNTGALRPIGTFSLLLVLSAGAMYYVKRKKS